jgi:hypothetical protein
METLSDVALITEGGHFIRTVALEKRFQIHPSIEGETFPHPVIFFHYADRPKTLLLKLFREKLFHKNPFKNTLEDYLIWVHIHTAHEPEFQEKLPLNFLVHGRWGGEEDKKVLYQCTIPPYQDFLVGWQTWEASFTLVQHVGSNRYAPVLFCDKDNIVKNCIESYKISWVA